MAPIRARAEASAPTAAGDQRRRAPAGIVARGVSMLLVTEPSSGPIDPGGADGTAGANSLKARRAMRDGPSVVLR
ncbi:hypothetical protein GCM10025874_25680 [Arenivirga flava]|uniref:Uncharacterized protein n=1 Tax=Arenivirga flava TaxID=1930060 RepID=A0AA37UNL5_9MICO|nr:hypothetical protein GCM10025874_25680 [Arenivirga flava]